MGREEEQEEEEEEEEEEQEEGGKMTTKRESRYLVLRGVVRCSSPSASTPRARVREDWNQPR